MKALVTGSGGIIGRELVKLLRKAGHAVTGLDKKPMDFTQRGGYVEADLATYGLTPVLKDITPDTVFHLAASFERTNETPDAFWKIWTDDTLGSHRLMAAILAETSVKKVIFASSYLIYDSAKYLVGKDNKHPEPLHELDAINPRNLCGMAKLGTERELEFMVKKLRPDITAISARIFRVYGCGSQDIVSRWARARQANLGIMVFNEDSCFDFIFAEDVAEGLKRLAEVDNPGTHEIVNLGTGASRAIYEVIDAMDFPEDSLTIAPDDMAIEMSSASISKLMRMTGGWAPTTTLEEGIDKVMKFEYGRRDVIQ